MKFLIAVMLVCFGLSTTAQQKVMVPGLSSGDSDVWILHDREHTFDQDVLHLNANTDDGLMWLSESMFSNGTVELDIKGKDERGRSFVGLAFHGLNEGTFDAIYFRPFNFKDKERNSHSVQYISHPDHTWSKLRENHPGVYENTISPPPEPEEWFHVLIQIEHPEVKVFVNNSDQPSLNVKQLSQRKKGWVGFWVGNNSEGDFKNLRITANP